MAEIRPFRPIRPNPELAHEIVCVPYDVVSRTEAAQLVENSPKSFLRVVRSDIEFPSSVDPHAPEVYLRARQNLAQYLESGDLFRDASPSLFLYRLRMGGHSQVGVVAAASLAEYDSGEIRIHEYTRHDKEEDRVRHIVATETQSEPVFLTYRADAQIDALVNETLKHSEPIYDLTTPDGVQHSVWKVERPESLTSAFENIPRLYIADGHHRSAAAAKARQAYTIEKAGGALPEPDDAINFVLATIFPHDQLQILPYHRAIRSSSKTDHEILQALRDNFTVTETNLGYPTDSRHFAVHLSGFWYLLTYDGQETGNPVRDLDVSILQEKVLEPILGIRDPRTDKNIDFIGGIRGIRELEQLVERNESRIAFSLYPVSIEKLFEIADRNEVMPPKSTWFEPKLRSGFFIYPFRRDQTPSAPMEKLPRGL